MKPVLFSLGPVTIYSYGVMVALAFLVTYFLVKRRAAVIGISEERIATLAWVMILSGMGGARIFYVIQHWPYYKMHLPEVVLIAKGGLVWYGAFMGACVAAIIYVRRHKLGILTTADLFLPYVALAQGIGRIGCFLNGCCYGVTTTWGQWPVQWMSFAGLVTLSVVLTAIARKNPKPGTVMICYGLGYGLLRFTLEFFRGDQADVWMGLTLAQLLSVALVLSTLIAQRKIK